MTDRIVAGVLLDRRRRQRRRVWVRVASVAAALMFAVLTFEYWPRPTPPDNPTPVVENKPESVRQVVVDAGSAVVDEAKRQVSEVVDTVTAKWPSLDLPPMDFESPLDSAEKPLLEAGQGVTASLEPMADSAKRAFALFVRDLSPGSMKNKPGL